MLMTDQKCCTSVQGVGVGLTPFSLVALLQTLACNVGGQTHTHTHQNHLPWSIELHVLCFTSLEKCFHCVRIKNHAKIALN